MLGKNEKIDFWGCRSAEEETKLREGNGDLLESLMVPKCGSGSQIVV